MSLAYLARGAAARLTEREAADLLHHAVHEGQALQTASNKRLGWLDMPRWDYDGESSTRTFSRGDDKIIADARVVGSFSKNTKTFQWGWDTVDERLPRTSYRPVHSPECFLDPGRLIDQLRSCRAVAAAVHVPAWRRNHGLVARLNWTRSLGTQLRTFGRGLLLVLRQGPRRSACTRGDARTLGEDLRRVY
jgi:hypothetical protein